MKKLKNIILLLLLAFCLQLASQVFALNTDTHKNINEFIGLNTLNEFSLDSYLKNQLALSDGKDEKFNSNRLRDIDILTCRLNTWGRNRSSRFLFIAYKKLTACLRVPCAEQAALQHCDSSFKMTAAYLPHCPDWRDGCF